MIRESTATDRVEPSSAPMTVPGDGAMERAGAREVVLQQGRELADSVIFQYERFCRAPFNKEEGARLRSLQGAFAAWERHANAQCPGLDTKEEFSDSRLRPFERKPSITDIARLRRMPSVLEAHFLSVSASKRTGQTQREVDDGIWPSAGPGV